MSIQVMKMTRYPGKFAMPESPIDLPPQSCLIVGERESGLQPLMDELCEKREVKLIRLQDLEGSEPKEIDKLISSDEGGTWVIDNTVFEASRAKHNSLNATGPLVRWLENKKWVENNKVFVFTHDVVTLKQGPFSTLIQRADVYYPAGLTSKEIKEQLKPVIDQLKKQEMIDPASIDKFPDVVRRYTGGQRALTEGIISEINQSLQAGDKQLSKEDVIAIFNEHELNPSSYVARWQEQLRELLKDPQLEEILTAYVDGEIKQKTEIFSWPEYQLFLAGWIAIEGDSVQIRSRLHGKWAAQVLREACS